MSWQNHDLFLFNASFHSTQLFQQHHSKKNHSIEEDSLDSESDSVTGSSLKENNPGGGHRGQNLPSKHERKLLKQNQRLLCEVERLVGELHQAKQEASYCGLF